MSRLRLRHRYSVIGTFDDNRQAQAALDQLFAGGLSSREISLLVSERSHGAHFVIEAGHKAAEGMVIGGVIGGTLGALTAGLSASFGVSLPGLGVLAVGPLLAVLAGVGVGGVVGGAVGGLIGLGFSEHQARLVEKTMLDGHIALGVQTPSDRKAKFARWAFEQQHATSIAA